MTTQVDATPIAMKAVESSRIAQIGHNAETNTLAIRFKRADGSKGALYHYANSRIPRTSRTAAAQRGIAAPA